MRLPGWLSSTVMSALTALPSWSVTVTFETSSLSVPPIRTFTLVASIVSYSQKCSLAFDCAVMCAVYKEPDAICCAAAVTCWPAALVSFFDGGVGTGFQDSLASAAPAWPASAFILPCFGTFTS